MKKKESKSKPSKSKAKIKTAPKKAKASKPAPKKTVKAKASKPAPKKTVKAKKVVKPAPPKVKVINKTKQKQVKPAKKKTTPVTKTDTTSKIQHDVRATNAQSPVKDESKLRYSEKELAEFKTLIIKKLDQAKKDYELLKNTLCHTDDHGTDDTSPTFKALEDGSDVLTREETAQLALRQEKFIQNLQNALIRIQNKTYGICRATGKLIPKERLLRVPHATLSIDAKLVQQFNS
jgi:RNA polymerase-binding transcription factor DksA